MITGAREIPAHYTELRLHNPRLISILSMPTHRKNQISSTVRSCRTIASASSSKTSDMLALLMQVAGVEHGVAWKCVDMHSTKCGGDFVFEVLSLIAVV